MPKRLLIIWTLFAAVMGFAFGGSFVWAIDYPNSQSTYSQPNQSTEAAANYQDKPNKTLWQRTTEDPTAFFTLWVAAFTFILAASTIGLWVETRLASRKQSREMRILQRAYLAVGAGGIDPLDWPGNSVAHIVIKNVGNLPARNVRWFIDAKFGEDGRRNDFPIDKSVIYGNNVVPPGTEMKRSQNFKATSEEVSALRKRKIHLYVWGEISYSDGFGESRFTKFCHRYSGGAVTFGDAYLLRPDSMRYHQYGNDAD